jgi:Aspartyl protease
MPHFLQSTSPQGLAVSAAVTVSNARRQALLDAGEPVPAAQQIVALLDTGASISAVDPSVLAALGLTATGKVEIHTPSTQGVPIHADTYDVCIGIFAVRDGDAHFISDPVQVFASILGNGVQALIGTDILKRCILTYNGADDCFTLAW